jgi:hypothetical protein
VLVLTKTKNTTCYGYWLSPLSPGFDHAYGALLSAFHSKSTVALTANENVADKWPGSSNHYCKLTRLNLIN